jgi:hypothetical protein
MNLWKRCLIFVVAILMAAPAQPLHASVGDLLLAEFNRDFGGGTRALLDTVSFYLAVEAPDHVIGIPSEQLFDAFTWTEGDDGAVLDLNATVDADFKHVAGLLADGIDERVLFGSKLGSGGGGQGVFESVLFHGGAMGTSPVDLAGHQLTRVQLAINAIALPSPGSDPNGDGLWTDVQANITYRFFGVVVPEPTSLVSAVSLLVVMVVRRVREW